MAILVLSGYLCFYVTTGQFSDSKNLGIAGILLVFSEISLAFPDFFGQTIEYLWLDCTNDTNENCGSCCYPQKLGSGELKLNYGQFDCL